jgi:hypothetical protein
VGLIDNIGANLAGLQTMNILLPMHDWLWVIEIYQAKCLNAIIEQ